MEAVSECAIAVARRIMAKGAMTIGLATVPSRHRRHDQHVPVEAFMTDLAAALLALTSVPATFWSAHALPLAAGESPLRQLMIGARGATEYFLCDLAGLSGRGEHGAAAAALQAVVVLAPTGSDDRDVAKYLSELPSDRVLGVVLTT